LTSVSISELVSGLSRRDAGGGGNGDFETEPEPGPLSTEMLPLRPREIESQE